MLTTMANGMGIAGGILTTIANAMGDNSAILTTMGKPKGISGDHHDQIHGGSNGNGHLDHRGQTHGDSNRPC